MLGMIVKLKSSFIKTKNKLSNKNRIKFGKRVIVTNGFFCTTFGGGQITIGNDVFFNRNCSIHSRCKVSVGNDCIFGEGVKVYDHNHLHCIDGTLFRNQGFNTGEITIGNNVWIGSNVIVLKGVSIGDNCVIGAGCVVFSDIPSNSVVVANQNLTIRTNKDNQ